MRAARSLDGLRACLVGAVRIPGIDGRRGIFAAISFTETAREAESLSDRDRAEDSEVRERSLPVLCGDRWGLYRVRSRSLVSDRRATSRATSNGRVAIRCDVRGGSRSVE